jgi:hypothetical protein
MPIFVYESGWQEILGTNAWIGDGSTVGGRALDGTWYYDSNTTTWRRIFSSVSSIVFSMIKTKTGTNVCSDSNEYTLFWTPTHISDVLHQLDMKIYDHLGTLCTSKLETSPNSVNSWTGATPFMIAGGNSGAYVVWELQLQSDSSIIQTDSPTIDTYVAGKLTATC